MQQDFFIRFFLYVSLPVENSTNSRLNFQHEHRCVLPCTWEIPFSATSPRNNDIQKLIVELVPFEFHEVNRGLDVKREGREIKEQNQIKVT